MRTRCSLQSAAIDESLSEAQKEAGDPSGSKGLVSSFYLASGRSEKRGSVAKWVRKTIHTKWRTGGWAGWMECRKTMEGRAPFEPTILFKSHTSTNKPWIFHSCSMFPQISIFIYYYPILICIYCQKAISTIITIKRKVLSMLYFLIPIALCPLFSLCHSFLITFIENQSLFIHLTFILCLLMRKQLNFSGQCRIMLNTWDETIISIRTWVYEKKLYVKQLLIKVPMPVDGRISSIVQSSIKLINLMVKSNADTEVFNK